MAYREYNPTSPLYHYTSPQGFEGMVETGSLWLSDLQFANDPKELQLATTLPQVMRELAEGATDEQWRDAYLGAIGQIEHLRKRFGIYSFSLSEKCDKLPMWQEYTDRGRGYCVEFRATAFNAMSLRIQKVRYVDPSYLGSLHALARELVEPLLGVKIHSFEGVEKFSPILALFATVKNDTWEHEDEVRLTFACMARPSEFKEGEVMYPIAMGPGGNLMFPQDPQLRSRSGIEIPYFVQNFGRFRNGSWDASRSIARVFLGHNNERSEADVAEYLTGLGYRDFDVSRSSCAFHPG